MTQFDKEDFEKAVLAKYKGEARELQKRWLLNNRNTLEILWPHIEVMIDKAKIESAVDAGNKAIDEALTTFKKRQNELSTNYDFETVEEILKELKR